MYPSQFAYHRPTSVQEAVRLLGADPEAKVMAGGHSLLPAMKLRLANPSAIVDIGRIGGLRGITVKGDGSVIIGALTTYQDLLDSTELRQSYPIVAETANVVGDPQVRVRGTIGGSLAHADPAADFTAVMLALNCEVTAAGPNGESQIGIDDLFVGLLTTSLNADEIITAIRLPSAAGRKVGQAYEKHAHPASGYAVVGVAAVLDLDGGTIRSARIAVTGAPDKATRATAAEQALAGKPATADAIAQAAAQATQGLGELNGDTYASAEYRGHLVRVLTRRALTRAAGI
ncbi:MAG: aerobic carbon-monoxide dehydrogenase medium subunit [Thermomicrobiales bacterium]|nr:aerobic carbon-monoxide dehydrogenase medium subunit [Thermomicrobiales bacterium]MEA2524158.1 aerobic carbon-monoxide dehydrogenase medium subunit [Thermomicrobiales bacterium]